MTARGSGADEADGGPASSDEERDPIPNPGLLPGGHTVFTYESRQKEVDYMRNSLATHFPYWASSSGLKYYAPGYKWRWMLTTP